MIQSISVPARLLLANLALRNDIFHSPSFSDASVRPSVRRSVTPSLRRLLGAYYAEYSALILSREYISSLTYSVSPHVGIVSFIYHPVL